VTKGNTESGNGARWPQVAIEPRYSGTCSASSNCETATSPKASIICTPIVLRSTSKGHLQASVMVTLTTTYLIVHPNGADHQRGKDPPRQMLVRSGS
jgi:hypothetical protein